MNNLLASFYRLIDQFPKTKILVIGDLMVDRFIRGKVSRISPEAPVPVVKVKEEVDLAGGSGNVLMNLCSLEANVVALGVIGQDIVGDHLMERFKNQGIDSTQVVRDRDRSTTLKVRVIAEHQQVVRYDRENDSPLSHSIEESLLSKIKNLVPQVDAIVLSDYGKGVITKRLLNGTIPLANRLRKPICVDPKVEHFLSYKNVTCITPNTLEALGGMRIVRMKPQDGIQKIGKDILKRLKCTSVLITQGEEGMTLFEKNSSTHIPAKAKEVYDVTGAGDTVIAVLTLSLACGATLLEAATLANFAAGIVVGKLGTATISPQELKKALRSTL